jgi:hypothetical protein
MTGNFSVSTAPFERAGKYRWVYAVAHHHDIVADRDLVLTARARVKGRAGEQKNRQN